VGRAPAAPEAALSAEELENLQRERHRLVSELEHAPAISADGLSSPQAIAANEGRFVALVVVLDRMNGRQTPVEGARGASRDLAATTKQRAHLERDVYAKSGKLLEYLRASWGQWKFDDGPGLPIHFASEEGQRRLNELADGLKMAQLDLDRADDNLRALRPVSH
jgi:hypothetical protein